MHISAKNALHYVKNFFLSNFTNIKIPYSAQIEITLRCNAKCSFCSLHSLPQSLVKQSKEMTTDQIKNITTQIADLGVVSLSFTGGEPTLRKDLPELIHHSSVKQDLLTGLVSNGYLLPSLLKKNKINELDYLVLSLDYPRARLHNEFRGLNIYEKVIESIKLATKKNIKVVISTVVMKDNIKYLGQICELAKELNCCVEMDPCEDIIREFQDETYQIDDLKDMIPDISKWASTVRSLRKEYKNIITDPVTIQVIENGGFGRQKNNTHTYYQNILRCHVVEAYLFVRYDGKVDYPCKIHPVRSFNALKYSIARIYRSKEVADMMKVKDNYDFCSGCRLGCAIASSMPARWKTLYAKYLAGFLNGNLN
ncbi:MAG: radical SAM protein [Candidatus Lokiarchaeota archaeon]|nr:radical SAM protein [Candidatus Lokiarchaeota archaeon]